MKHACFKQNDSGQLWFDRGSDRSVKAAVVISSPPPTDRPQEFMLSI